MDVKIIHFNLLCLINVIVNIIIVQDVYSYIMINIKQLHKI